MPAIARVAQWNYEYLAVVDTMSVDIAAVLREEAKTAHAIAGRLTDTHDKAVLQQLAAKLVEIAERLERDARD